MCNGCHQFINLQNTPRPRHHSPFMGLADRPGRTWSRICTRPIARATATVTARANDSVVLIPSLRCAYNKNTKRKKLRKFAKRSDMNFFLLFKKMKERQQSSRDWDPRALKETPSAALVSPAEGAARRGQRQRNQDSPLRLGAQRTPILHWDSKPVSRGAQHDLGLKLRWLNAYEFISA